MNLAFRKVLAPEVLRFSWAADSQLLYEVPDDAGGAASVYLADVRAGGPPELVSDEVLDFAVLATDPHRVLLVEGPATTPAPRPRWLLGRVALYGLSTRDRQVLAERAQVIR